MNSKLEIKNLQIGYKYALTEDINLELHEGEIACIVGRNGTGKSTLLNTLAGITPPLKGDIKIDNENLLDIKPSVRATKISYVPSRQAYLSNLTVSDLVTMGRSPYTNIFDKKSRKDKQIINHALEYFELTKLANKNLYSISDGERQKAMICRAFVQETKVILLDEPTSFLDYYSKQKLLKTLKDLVKEQNRSIVFSTHDLEISLKHVNNIWLFQNENVTQYTLKELKETKILEDILSFKFYSYE